MEKSIFNKKFILAILTIFVFVFAIQMIDPASAVKSKLVKKGVKYIHSTSGYHFKYSYKIYKQGKYKATVKSSLYGYESKKKVAMKLTFTRISKKYLRVKFYINGHLYKSSKFRYVTSVLNYAKIFNSAMINQFAHGGSL